MAQEGKPSPGGLAIMLPGAPPPPPVGQPEELIPTLNVYVRSKLTRSEVLNFADCARALGE